MSNDRNKQSDQTPTTPSTDDRAQRGIDRISKLLEARAAQVPHEEQSVPVVDNAVEQRSEQSESSADSSLEESPQPLEKTSSTPGASSEQRKGTNWIEASIIAVPLIFSAASSEVPVSEIQQRREQPAHAITQVTEGQRCAIKPGSSSEKQTEIDPDVALLADAHDLGQQRRSEEDAAGRSEEPTVSGSGNTPPA